MRSEAIVYPRWKNEFALGLSGGHLLTRGALYCKPGMMVDAEKAFYREPPKMRGQPARSTV